MKDFTINPHISLNNSKLGDFIPSVNLPPVKTCRPDAPCRGLCYARRGNFAFPSVKTSMERNLMLYQTNSEWFFCYIKMFLKASGFKHFRWFGAGDIVDDAFFEGMVDVARSCRSTRFLCFTKRFEIVNDYINKNGALPKNLTVVFSNWGSFICDNPHNLPTSWVELKTGAEYIPENATRCSGFCGECVNTKASCWRMKAGQAVVFRQH